MSDVVVDVHQHLWPEGFVHELRRRSRPPCLRGWELATAGEPPYVVTAADHDLAVRRRLLEKDGVDLAVLSLSSPLGIEYLEPDDAYPLLDAWHAGVRGQLGRFAGWASVPLIGYDLAELRRLLESGFVGLQLPACAIGDPRSLECRSDLLALCEEVGKPVLVHPGPVVAGSSRPTWWAPAVSYVGQLNAAWWSWQAIGRTLLPDLRICFAAGAGLAPLQHERVQARGGPCGAVDAGVFVEVSSYGPRAIDALARVIGMDVLVFGSDRPYASPPHHAMGAAADHALTVRNPKRLLEGDVP
jgi:predicted TIM-barrel fold metal-dependent hydrolase